MSLIPCVIPPLHELRVLVTRPEPQATQLAAAVKAHGGEPILLPSIEIQPIAADPIDVTHYQWLVFLSAHAVAHSKACLTCTAGPRVAAIGQATASALTTGEWKVDVVPQEAQTTEGLLTHPEFVVEPDAQVLIVRGAGGREALDDVLRERGARIDSLIVYQRVPSTHDPAHIAALEQQWSEGGIDVVTATSADTLTHLMNALTPPGKAALARTPLAVVSPRVADRARELGLSGEIILTSGADDASIVGHLASWAARAR